MVGVHEYERRPQRPMLNYNINMFKNPPPIVPPLGVLPPNGMFDFQHMPRIPPDHPRIQHGDRIIPDFMAIDRMPPAPFDFQQIPIIPPEYPRIQHGDRIIPDFMAIDRVPPKELPPIPNYHPEKEDPAIRDFINNPYHIIPPPEVLAAIAPKEKIAPKNPKIIQ